VTLSGVLVVIVHNQGCKIKDDTMNNNTGIVFIHGAGLNGSIWDDLLKEINTPVLVIDFANRKTDGKTPKKSMESQLFNDLTAEQTKKIVNDFTPESKALSLTKINFNLPDIHRLYV
jgi:hypothetical protein